MKARIIVVISCILSGCSIQHKERNDCCALPTECHVDCEKSDLNVDHFASSVLEVPNGESRDFNQSKIRISNVSFSGPEYSIEHVEKITEYSSEIEFSKTDNSLSPVKIRVNVCQEINYGGYTFRVTHIGEWGVSLAAKDEAKGWDSFSIESNH